MAFLKRTGEVTGKISNGVIGGTVKFTGETVGKKFKITGEWIEDGGTGAGAATETVLPNTCQFLDGTLQSGYGLLKKEADRREWMERYKRSFNTKKQIESWKTFIHNHLSET